MVTIVLAVAVFYVLPLIVNFLVRNSDTGYRGRKLDSIDVVMIFFPLFNFVTMLGLGWLWVMAPGEDE
jgi:bacteriorhodopsin